MTHGTAETSVSSVATIAPAHALAVMVAKIGCIIFVVEILIMIGLYGLDDAVTLGEGMLMQPSDARRVAADLSMGRATFRR